MRNFYLILLFTLLSGGASAHSFDERYDLPIPLEFFLVGSGLVVAITFLLILLASYYCSASPKNRFFSICTISPAFAQLIKIACQFLGFVGFLLVIAAGYWGPGNPLLNLAPNFIWITWWLGFSISNALLGNFWPLFNPWLAIFAVLEKFIHLLGGADLLKKPLLIFPETLGLYLATAFLLLWSWMEVVYPIAFVPARIANLALWWTAINLCGMFLFGKKEWQNKGDFFSIYFFMLGQFGIFCFCSKTSSLKLRAPGEGVLWNFDLWRKVRGIFAFIIAMLSIVLFDGLHGSSAWDLFAKLTQLLGLSQFISSEYALGTAGLLIVWLVFAGLFYLSCLISSMYSATTASELMNIFSTALIPIAVGYLLAHNFSSLLIQGQSIIFLISDPFGLGWDVFGTASYRPKIDVIDAGTTWYFAVISIVLGHVIALILNHYLAMKLTGSTRSAAMISIPQTILMILLTMLSLVILAEPMTSSDYSILQELCITREQQ